MRTGLPIRIQSLNVEVAGNAHVAAVVAPVANAVWPLDNANAPIVVAHDAVDHANSANYCFKNRSISLQRTSSILIISPLASEFGSNSKKRNEKGHCLYFYFL